MVINVSVCGVIEMVCKYKNKFGCVYVGCNGIFGVLMEDMIDMMVELVCMIVVLRYMLGGVFGFVRYKFKGFDKNCVEYEWFIEVFRVYDIGYFFYNGGGDFMDIVYKVL